MANGTNLKSNATPAKSRAEKISEFTEKAAARQLDSLRLEAKNKAEQKVSKKDLDIIKKSTIGQIATEFTEKAAARQLESLKMATKQFVEKRISEEDLELLEDFARAGAKIFSSPGVLRAGLTGIELGYELRKALNRSKFEGVPFMIALGCCIVKDTFDPASLGVIGTALNIVLVGILFIIFFGRGMFLRRQVLKRVVAPLAIEFIPWVNMVPLATIAIIWLKLRIHSEIVAKEREIEAIEKKSQQLLSYA